MRFFFRLVALTLMFALLIPTLALAEEEKPVPAYSRVTVHDPSVILAGDGKYYIYGSHMAAAWSEDLIKWKMFSRNAESGCTLVEDVQTQMHEALSWAKTSTFWASDVQQLADGRYYLYYCTCEGSSPLSALGLAVSDKPEGPYEDLGIFLKSGMPGYDATRYPNAIDPHTFFDKEGKLWMVYGSYSGGIFILEMDPQTGLPLEGQEYGKKLLGGNHSRIEGPYILYSPDTDYYYLFLSFGGLNAADGYNIRVCRSKNPDGPYVDALGQEMINCMGKPGTYFNDPDYEPYGVKLMGGYCFEPIETDNTQRRTAYRSPGHNSAIYDAETGRYFIIFHSRFANNGEAFTVMVHQMAFNQEGWPVIFPTRYAGETLTPVEPEQQTGLYKLVFHQRDINLTEHSSCLATLNADGTVTGDVSGSWRVENGTQITLELDGTVYTGVLSTGADSLQKEWVSAFTAMDSTGAALWGVHAVNVP